MNFTKKIALLTLAGMIALSPVLATSVFAESDNDNNGQRIKNEDRGGFGRSIRHFFGGKDKSKDESKDDRDEDRPNPVTISAEDKAKFCDNKAWLARILPPGIYKEMDKRLCNGNVPTTPDTVAPVISNVTVTDIGATKVKINWTTDERSTSDIAYGLTTSYGNMITHYGPVRDHRVEIKDLVANTTYHFQVISKDASGNVTRGVDTTFVTSAPSLTGSGEHNDN